jgi:CAAX prenyl protease-like protein
VRVVGSCLLVPVVEELAFRGFLLRWLVSPEFERVPPRAWTWWAVLLSSVAFGALHSHWILGTLAGLAFAAARLRRGHLGDAIFAHALANAGIAVAVLAFGRWDLWA